jgi:hypothetical protein
VCGENCVPNDIFDVTFFAWYHSTISFDVMYFLSHQNAIHLFFTFSHYNFQASKPAAKPAAGAAPRFEIKKWNAVAMWSWDICADTVSG